MNKASFFKDGHLFYSVAGIDCFTHIAPSDSGSADFVRNDFPSALV